jgi:DHA2 family multidrug resistance protein
LGLSADHGGALQLSQRFSQFCGDAQAMALKHLMQITHRQGVVMAFGDVSLLLTFLFGGLALTAMLVHKPAPTTAAPVH